MTILKETCCDLKVVSRLLKSHPTPSRFLSQVLHSVCLLWCIWCHLIWTAVSERTIFTSHMKCTLYLDLWKGRQSRIPWLRSSVICCVRLMILCLDFCSLFKQRKTEAVIQSWLTQCVCSPYVHVMKGNIFISLFS